jgi:hypothetical protein
MITIKFDTFNHTLDYSFDGINKTFENVTTIKVHEGYYEVLQRQMTTDKNAPLFRVPINNTIIEFTHE